MSDPMVESIYSRYVLAVFALQTSESPVVLEEARRALSDLVAQAEAYFTVIAEGTSYEAVERRDAMLENGDLQFLADIKSLDVNDLTAEIPNVETMEHR